MAKLTQRSDQGVTRFVSEFQLLCIYLAFAIRYHRISYLQSNERLVNTHVRLTRLEEQAATESASMAQAAIGTPSRKVCTQLGGAPAGLRKTAAIQRPSASPARAVTTEAAKKKGGAKRQDIRVTVCSITILLYVSLLFCTPLLICAGDRGFVILSTCRILCEHCRSHLSALSNVVAM